MGRRNRILGRHVVSGNGSYTVWRYDKEEIALALATKASGLLPPGVTGTASVSRVKRTKKGSDTTSYIPTVRVGELEYYVAIDSDGETPVALRYPKNAHPSIQLLQKSKEVTS